MHGESQDKVALVTGAGSPTGIGFACARVLAREGASVAVASTTDRIHERAATLHGDGADAAGFIADLTDRSQARRMVAEVQQLFGRIDIVVNNAGMVNVGMDGENFLDFIDMNDADWDLDIAMNLHTAYNVTKPVVPGMIERGWGRIVMVSSVTGPFVTNPGSTGYGAAKAGMDGLMRGVALELGPHGITANSVAPGWIASGSQVPDEADAGRFTPIGRSGMPDEVAEVVAFLASGSSELRHRPIARGRRRQHDPGGQRPLALRPGGQREGRHYARCDAAIPGEATVDRLHGVRGGGRGCVFPARVLATRPAGRSSLLQRPLPWG